ncbi:MAG: hypothetical protein BWX47_02149 [candidate division Hyd24-12 bacterium ADurb.Bin004]|nr:MAG: hypothetical protein BWX47_02149 [candidate division Hyd24-12 bacterium ADurb.Bin004]
MASSVSTTLQWKCDPGTSSSAPSVNLLTLKSKLSFLCDTGREWASGRIRPFLMNAGTRLYAFLIFIAACVSYPPKNSSPPSPDRRTAT